MQGRAYLDKIRFSVFFFRMDRTFSPHSCVNRKTRWKEVRIRFQDVDRLERSALKVRTKEWRRASDRKRKQSWTVLADNTHMHIYTYMYIIHTRFLKVSFLTVWDCPRWRGKNERSGKKIKRSAVVIGRLFGWNKARIVASVRKVTRLETGNQSSCFLRSVIRTRRNERKREKERRGFSNERTGSVGRFAGLTCEVTNTGAKYKRRREEG